jgi:integral membrane sensor domain MASE1
LRWKLLIIASLVAAIIGAVGAYSVGYAFYHFPYGYRHMLLLEICGDAVPVASSLFVGVFVYRHTARRRKLQVVITVLLSFLLSWSLLILLTLQFVHFIPD